MVMQEQGKRIVGRDMRKRQGFVAGQRTDITTLVQHDTVPRSDGNRNLIVPTEIAIQTDRLQIIADNSEQSCVIHLDLKLLPKLSAQCRHFFLSIVDAATEQAPVAGVPNMRNVIAQLHYVATILEHEQCCDGVAGSQWGARCQKVCSGQDYGPLLWMGPQAGAGNIHAKPLVITVGAAIRPTQAVRTRCGYEFCDNSMG